MRLPFGFSVTYFPDADCSLPAEPVFPELLFIFLLTLQQLMGRSPNSLELDSPSRSRYSFHDFLSFANNFNVNLLPYFNNLLYHFEHKLIDINVKIKIAAGRAAFFLFSGPRFALENRIHWLCGQASANFAAGRAAFFLLSGPRFALENRIHWLCGQAGANRAAGRAGHK